MLIISIQIVISLEREYQKTKIQRLHSKPQKAKKKRNKNKSFKNTISTEMMNEGYTVSSSEHNIFYRFKKNSINFLKHIKLIEITFSSQENKIILLL